MKKNQAKRLFIILAFLLAVPAMNWAQQSPSPITITVKGVSFKMILVEGGTFTMGAPSKHDSDAADETPTEEVTLSSYYIGETEVTQALWEAVMGSNPSRFKGENLPVDRVSWYDCQEFIKKLNALTGKIFRLPSEAEWEFAARGGNKSRDYIYSGGNDIDEVAWYDEYNDGPNYTTHAVKTKKPNELGIYDMSGNVREWCSDWYGNYIPDRVKDPENRSCRVLRGGSFNRGAGRCMVSFCDGDHPGSTRDCYGLRLVLGH